MDQRLSQQPGHGGLPTAGSSAPGRSWRENVGWSAAAVLGRQASQVLTALVLARLLGPASYGVIGAATVYVSLTTLILDQGLATAVVQRPVLGPRTAGAVATANLVTSAALALVTWVVAPAVGAFFGSAALVELVRVLGLGVMVKAVAITPRALLMRGFAFRRLAFGDLTGGLAGALFGIGAAAMGAGIWAMAWQVLATDLAVAAVLVAGTRGARPNLHLRELGAILPFSLRVFASNCLAFLSRNADNILVGRFLGLTALSYYSMAYRVLVLPVQLIGQTVNRVALPTLARLAGQPHELAAAMQRLGGMLATVVLPPMAFVSVAAPELIAVVLGPAWSDAAVILAVLAIAGARETVLIGTHSLMRALGRGRLILRYEIGATLVQLGGIVAGLTFGVVGVAVGLTLAGFALTPVLMIIQRRLAGVSLRKQLRVVWPAAHASGWGVGGYLLVRSMGEGTAATLLGGFLVFALCTWAVLRLVHHVRLAALLGPGRASLTPDREVP